ncbi:MAG: hypothetical protein JW779_12150 [Candidatus Thorarchaeota archaeon]|nr:hypothetical protein [Candidatus Thorarchaeota archaeon]
MDADELLEKYGSKIDRLYDTVASADVFERQFGAELTSWELQFQRQFRVQKQGRSLHYQGFVHYTRDPSIILLSPSPWLIDGVFIHFQQSIDMPPDGSYVAVSGPSIAIPRILERTQKLVRAINAENVELVSHDLTSQVSAPPRLRDLTSMLFENVGMANASKRVFSQLYVSSPPTLDAVGGLTAGIQALASEAQVKRLFRFMRDVLPPSMRASKRERANIQGVLVDIPKLWRLESGPVRNSRIEELCVKRRDPSGFREVSLAAITQSTTGTMPDVPIALATEDFWVESSNPSLYRLPIIKAAITYQLISPEVSQRSIDTGISYIEERLEILRNSFGLEERSFSRGQILDADIMGRPLSAVKLARASARASWQKKITSKEIKKAWDAILEPALKEYIEIAEIKERAASQWDEETRLDGYNSKILRALQKLDSGKKGSPGPTLGEIAEEAGVEKHEAAQTLHQMKDDGVVYEPRLGHYRMV